MPRGLSRAPDQARRIGGDLRADGDRQGHRRAQDLAPPVSPTKRCSKNAATLPARRHRRQDELRPRLVDLTSGLLTDAATADALAYWRDLQPAETLVGEDVAWPRFVTELRACANARRGTTWTRQLCSARKTSPASAAKACRWATSKNKRGERAAASVGPRRRERGRTVALDAATRRNLEPDTHAGGRNDHTLLGVPDRSVTPMGARALKRSLLVRCASTRCCASARAIAAHARLDALRETLRGVAIRPHPRARRAALGAAARPVDAARATAAPARRSRRR